MKRDKEKTVVIFRKWKGKAEHGAAVRKGMRKLITNLKLLALLVYGIWVLPALAREADQNAAARAKD